MKAIKITLCVLQMILSIFTIVYILTKKEEIEE